MPPSSLRRLAAFLALLALLAAGAVQGCSGDPAGPDAASDTLFAAVTVGESHSCGLTRGGRALCWGYNESGEVGKATGPDDGCRDREGRPLPCFTTPVPVVGGHLFTQLAAAAYSTCGLTADGSVFCWGGGLLGPLSFTPKRVTGAPPLRILAAAPRNLVCGLDDGRRSWCWSAAAVASGVESDDAAIFGGRTAREFTPGLRFAALGAACGTTEARALYCWAGFVDTTVFDPGSVALQRCFAGASRTEQFFAPCSPFAVRLRTTTPLARPADRKRECAQDATGTPLCLAGAAAGGTPDNAAVLEPIGYPEPVVTVFGAPDGAGATCGRTAGGKVYCKGYLGVGHAGDGTRDGPVGGPALVAGGMTFASASTSSQHMCGVTAEGAAYCWGYDLFGQVGAGGTAHELCIDSVPSAIPLVACVLRPRRVTVLARP